MHRGWGVPSLVDFHDIRPGDGVGLFQPRNPHGGALYQEQEYEKEHLQVGKTTSRHGQGYCWWKRWGQRRKIVHDAAKPCIAEEGLRTEQNKIKIQRCKDDPAILSKSITMESTCMVILLLVRQFLNYCHNSRCYVMLFRNVPTQVTARSRK